MRLVMMGTGNFALPTFRALYDSPHQVLALVTQPLRPVRGPQPENPLRALAKARGTPILDPVSINAPEARDFLAGFRPDVLVVADYGQILARETLAVARHGGLNLHGSLLPKYRGAAPINWAIYHGDAETGVTTILMTPQIDAGPALLQARLPIGPEETAATLEPKLAELGVPLVLESLSRIEAGQIDALPQDPALACRAPRLKKTDGVIDWSRSAQAIHNQVRALEPWPRSYTFWHHGAAAAMRWIVEGVSVLAGGSPAAPGTVLASGAEGIEVACGEDRLLISRLQPAGKRSMAAAEFLCGHAVEPGDRLGPELPADG